MKRIIIFLLITASITALIALLFGVIVCAPEPWQDRPWTVWERSAQIMFTVLCWPLWLVALLASRLGWNIPDKAYPPLNILLMILSGAFWAYLIDFARNKKKNNISEQPVAGYRRQEASQPDP